MQIDVRMGEHEAARWRPWVEGWSEDILPWYDALARALPRGATVVELGTARGRSALFLAERLTLLERRDVELWCVDTWEGDELDKMIRTLAQYPRLQATASSGLADDDAVSMLRLMRCTSTRAARLFDDDSVDVVFVDADHSYEGVTADIRAWLPKLKINGILAGHDYAPADWPGCVQAVDELAASYRCEIEHPTRSVWQFRFPGGAR